MSGTQYAGVLVLTVVVSLLGSSVLSRLVWPDGVTAQPGHRGIITTKGIQLVNDGGEVRGSLILRDGEYPALILSDKDCDRRVAMSVYPKERAALALFGEKCKRRAVLELEADGLPELVLRDQFDTPRSRIHLLKDGSPRVVLYGPHGKISWTAP